MKMKMKITLISLVLLVSVLALVGFQEGTPELPDAKAQQIHYAKQINQKVFNGEADVNVSHQSNAPSLRGLEQSLAFTLDDKQQLIPTYSIREMFDFYLSSLGEEDIQTILVRIRSEIESSLSEPARSEALSLLKRYVDFKIALAESPPAFNQHQSNPALLAEDLAVAQEQLVALRRSYFSALEYESFFGEEDAQVAFTVEQLRINSNPSLSPEERSMRLEQASQILPDHVRESRAQSQKHALTRTKVNQLRESGASEEDVYRFREQEFGAEAAVALAQLDNKRSKWKARLGQFSAERNAILDSGLSELDKSSAINELLITHFDATEQKRARALMNDGRFD